jgi:hypothetical protein
MGFLLSVQSFVSIGKYARLNRTKEIVLQFSQKSVNFCKIRLARMKLYG